MRKIESCVSLFVVLLLLLYFPAGISVYTKETLVSAAEVKASSTYEANNPAISESTCTERCHVNFMRYENIFEASQGNEIFRHKTHSFEQGLDCISCHDDSVVNSEGHGRLTIEKANCLKCHHVELKDSVCKRCHRNIDENPMKYKDERFVHGFTAETDVDCGLCHVKDPNASIIEEGINCVKCHHTTPDLDCVKCHENDLDKYHNTDLRRRDNLAWTVTFTHSQHPKQDVLCVECHLVTHENDTGIVEYNLNCSKCHHVSEKTKGCIACHKEPSEFLKGKTEIEGVPPMPDMMSRAVACEDCHKYNERGLQFMDVEENCIECHNRNYGKLYNAWIKTINDRLNELNSRVQTLVEVNDSSGMDEADVGSGRDIMMKEDASDSPAFPEKAGSIVNLIKRYGIHNFNLTETLLHKLEEEIALY